MRKNIIAANWKMNLDRTSAFLLAEKILQEINSKQDSLDIILACPYVYLYEMNILCKDFHNVHIAAQNCYSESAGAYTGEISVSMIQSLGVNYIVLGHSERREIFQENSLELQKKVDLAIQHNMNVIFCCGENLHDRENNVHFDVVKKQLKHSLFHLSSNDFSSIIIAYEPVWAIGTGQNASSDQAEEMHKFIRSLVQENYGEHLAEKCSILYGGSCNPSNARELFLSENIDGGLIGGASLSSSDFIKIIESV